MSGLFAEWQPRYAEVGLPSFPVAGKKPAIKGYMNIGLPASRALAGKFGDASAFGIPLGCSKITVLDVDTTDERVLADAMGLYGRSPFVVRSNSGWHAWYRSSGEGRRVRPDRSVPIDILGAGFIVAPPSRGTKRAYAIVEGDLADLENLPTMAKSGCGNFRTYNCTPSPPPLGALAGVSPGDRNHSLWKYLMAQAPYCDDADALIDVARTAAAAFASPLPDPEVVKTALSAWKYQSEDKNWIAGGKRPPEPSEPAGLIWVSPDALLLLHVLRHYNRGRTSFFIANEMAKTMPLKAWDRERFAAARKVLLDHGHIVLLRPASTGRPAVYAWGPR